jgi:hypothetical protein
MPRLRPPPTDQRRDSGATMHSSGSLPEIVVMSWRTSQRRAQGPRYKLTVESSGGRYLGFTLEPTAPGYEGLRINFGQAESDVDRLLAVRLARMIAGTPSSCAWATQYDYP